MEHVRPADGFPDSYLQSAFTPRDLYGLIYWGVRGRMPIFRFSIRQIGSLVILTGMFLGGVCAAAQSRPRSNLAKPSAGANYSGMYAFLQEGEFVQITVEGEGRVTGFVSRYGDSESDRGVFLDHFFKSGKLDGNQLEFTTDTVHGVSFEFQGTIERGEGRSRGDEAYYVLKGALIETRGDDAKKTSSQRRQVELKSFPQDLSPPPEKK